MEHGICRHFEAVREEARNSTDLARTDDSHLPAYHLLHTAYKDPLVYNFKVFTSLARQVYIAEKLAPPTNLNTWINAYTKIWSSAVSPNYWKGIAQNGQWAKVGVYVSLFGRCWQYDRKETEADQRSCSCLMLGFSSCCPPAPILNLDHLAHFDIPLVRYLSNDTGSRGLRSLQDRRDRRTKELGRIQVARVDPCLASVLGEGMRMQGKFGDLLDARCI